MVVLRVDTSVRGLSFFADAHQELQIAAKRPCFADRLAHVLFSWFDSLSWIRLLLLLYGLMDNATEWITVVWSWYGLFPFFSDLSLGLSDGQIMSLLRPCMIAWRKDIILRARSNRTSRRDPKMSYWGSAQAGAGEHRASMGELALQRRMRVLCLVSGRNFPELPRRSQGGMLLQDLNAAPNRICEQNVIQCVYSHKWGLNQLPLVFFTISVDFFNDFCAATPWICPCFHARCSKKLTSRYGKCPMTPRLDRHWTMLNQYFKYSYHKWHGLYHLRIYYYMLYYYNIYIYSYI